MNYIDHTIIEKVYQPRNSNSHKGDYGKILCIAGSEDYSGAAYLATHASIATLRTGTDIITVAAPKKVAWTINSLTPDVITKKIDCAYFTSNQLDEILDISKSFDCILIGPGLGQNSETYLFVNELINKMKKPFIIDADAIKAINLKNVSNSVITPHRKELEIIISNSDISINKDIELQKHIGTNVLLIKDNIDTIITKHEILYNKTGNPGMTVGGTGDVLSGLVAGFIAQGNSLIDSASASAYLCGYVGDRLFKENNYGFIASDFINEIPKAIKKIIN